MRLLLGSTARSVLRQARCSVEIVRPSTKGRAGRQPGMKVLIATDGSDFSSGDPFGGKTTLACWQHFQSNRNS